MSVFQSFQTGLAIGQEQRKERDRTAAQSSAAELFKLGNYEGAESALIGIGDYQGADAYASAGQRRKDAEKRKAYGEAFKIGGATGLRDAAGQNADFETYGMAQGIDDSNVLRERQTKTWAKEDYQQGIAFLAQQAPGLKQFAMEERGAKALELLAQTPYGEDPQIVAAIERAAADGRIDDFELDQFTDQMLSAYERIQLENADRDFNEGTRRFDLGHQLDVRRTNAAEAEAMAAAMPQNPAGLTTDQIKLEADFSNKWMPVQNNFADIKQQYSRIATLGADLRPNGEPFDPAQQAVNDLALVVAFTKMLDPGSVAREGEVELTKKSASLLGEASTWLPRLQKGGTLLPAETRKALVQAATDMMPAYENAYQKLARDNVNRIQDYGMSPERIMLGYEFDDGNPAPGSQVFKGGATTQIPQGAVQELMSDPSPEAMREFDDYFGPGQAQKVLQQRGQFPSRVTF